MNKLHNKNKKGTIILSHYRSGGTQLKEVISNVLEVDNLGEIDFNLNNTNFEDEFYSKLSLESYGVILVNNPIVISWINSNDKALQYIKDNFQVVCLKRKDVVKSLLSLGLWERFILSGLFKSYENWTKENMEQFHQDTLDRLLPPKEVGLGYKSIVENSDNTHHSHLNQVVKIFLDELNTLETISNKLSIDILFYEDYESDKEFLVKYFPKYDKASKIIKDTYLGKIPYVSSDYSVYYEDSVREILKSWGMLND